MAAATSPGYFAVVDGLLTSWLGYLVLLGMTWALAYHMLNGIRHLIWDLGYGFEMETVERSGIAVVIGSGVLTALLWLVA
jgi:succinate dehydrogenase / fumarate reductase cytochrome b subunit